MDPNSPVDLLQEIDDFKRRLIVVHDAPSLIRSKDGLRNLQIKYRLKVFCGIDMVLSKEDDGDDAWIIRGTIIEPIEIKTCLIPKRGSKKKIPGFSFHEDQVPLLNRLSNSGLILVPYDDDEFGVEQLREIWYAPAGSEIHQKHFESRLRDRSREGKEMTITLTDARKYARRLYAR